MSTSNINSIPITNVMNKSNDLNDQCYCQKSRDLFDIELQCCNCAKWFHKKCIEIDTGPLVKFMMNYQFSCKNCGVNNKESFLKKQASFHHLCVTALANLTQENSSKKFFSKDKDIIPFIEKNWESMTIASRRSKPTWHSTVSRTMTRDDVFLNKLQNSEQFYALKEAQLERLGPFNENFKLIRSSSVQATLADATQSLNNSNLDSNLNEFSSSSSSRRGSKRKVSDNSSSTVSNNGYSSSYNGLYGAFGSNSSANNSKKRGGINDLSRLEKMVPTCFPNDHPFNKDGYRYHLVEPDPHSPMRQKFEETELWAGKPLPGHLYRLFLENKVALALHDRAPQLKLSEDRLTVTGEKGYSMVRATHCVSNGAYYFEVTIKEKPNSSALRIGWAQALANLQAPCGYDKFSYSWRSRKGTIFHDSHGKTYSRLIEESDQNDSKSDGGYSVGDVLGFYINLPLNSNDDFINENSHLLPDSCKQMTLVKFKNHLYYEEKDNFSAVEKSLVSLKGSQIMFFKNGKSHGIAYTDIYQGSYYPAVSLYKNATVTLNFGPNFKYPISNLELCKNCKPISDLAFEKFVEHSLADLNYHVTCIIDGTYEQA